MHRARLGFDTKGPTKVITDLCVMEPDAETKRTDGDEPAPGSDHGRREARRPAGTSRLRRTVDETPAPTTRELETLRDLQDTNGGRPCWLTPSHQSLTRAAPALTPGMHPDPNSPAYRATELRHPKQPLIIIPQTLTELTRAGVRSRRDRRQPITI